MIVFVEGNVMEEGKLAHDSIFQKYKGKLQTFNKGNYPGFHISEKQGQNTYLQVKILMSPYSRNTRANYIPLAKETIPMIPYIPEIQGQSADL